MMTIWLLRSTVSMLYSVCSEGFTGILLLKSSFTFYACLFSCPWLRHTVRKCLCWRFSHAVQRVASCFCFKYTLASHWNIFTSKAILGIIPFHLLLSFHLEVRIAQTRMSDVLQFVFRTELGMMALRFSVPFTWNNLIFSCWTWSPLRVLSL